MYFGVKKKKTVDEIKENENNIGMAAVRMSLSVDHTNTNGVMRKIFLYLFLAT